MDAALMRVIGRHVLPVSVAPISIGIRCKSYHLVMATTQHSSFELWPRAGAKNEWMPLLVEFRVGYGARNIGDFDCAFVPWIFKVLIFSLVDLKHESCNLSS